MELTLPLTHNTGSSPVGSPWAGPDVPGRRAVIGLGYCDPVPRDGAERITGKQREKGDKLMTLGRTTRANSARREDR